MSTQEKKVWDMMKKYGYVLPPVINCNPTFDRAVMKYQNGSIFVEHLLINITEGRLLGYARISKEEYNIELEKINREITPTV